MKRVILGLLAGLACARAEANICGTDYQNFNPTTNGLDFVTVHSSETLKPCVINAGLFFNYATNSLTYSKTLNALVVSGQKRKDSVLGADLSAGMGITDRWDFGISIPMVLNQKVQDDYFVSSFESTGITEIKLNSKYRILGDETGGLAGIVSLNKNMIQDNPFTGQNPGPTLNFELAADTVIAERWAVAVNGGYRKRSPGDPYAAMPFIPMRDQWMYSIAGSYYVPSMDSKMILEIFGSRVAQPQNIDADRNMNSLEGLLGFKYDASQNLALHFGGSKQLDTSVGGPDWRVYAGLNWAIGPVCGDKPTLVASSEPLAPVVKDEPETYRLDSEILFDYDQKELNQGSLASLGGLVEKLTVAGFEKLSIEGHTDSVGPDVYNLYLSQVRADQVKKYLVEKLQFPAMKLEAKGYGDTRPVADNGNYQGRRKNRRVDMIVWRKLPAVAATAEPAVSSEPAASSATPVPAATPAK
ncbi:MAG: OmpA family protein [Bdellovibrionota bacterium]